MADASAPAVEGEDGWEPSELAEQLKREYSRAKRRRNRWGAKVEQATIVVAPAEEQVNTTEAMQMRLDEINQRLKTGEVRTRPCLSPPDLPRRARPPLPQVAEAEREALQASRNELVKQIVSAKFGGSRGASATRGENKTHPRVRRRVADQAAPATQVPLANLSACSRPSSFFPKMLVLAVPSIWLASSLAPVATRRRRCRQNRAAPSSCAASASPARPLRELRGGG